MLFRERLWSPFLFLTMVSLCDVSTWIGADGVQMAR